jgi:hypothetical protein
MENRNLVKLSNPGPDLCSLIPALLNAGRQPL